jgi:hypothetical protein
MSEKAKPGTRRVVLVAEADGPCENEECCPAAVRSVNDEHYSLGYDYCDRDDWSKVKQDFPENSVVILEATDVMEAGGDYQVWKVVKEEKE